MILICAENAPVLFVCMTGADAMTLRAGGTLYVDPVMTQKRFFNTVVISQHKTKDDIIAMVRSIDPHIKIPAHLPEPPARDGESKCSKCGGSNPPYLLFEGTCIVCWAAEAKSFRRASN